MQHEQPTDVARHERLVRHPIRATEEEAAHLREVADEGESPATPAILGAAVLAVVVLLVAILIFLAFAIPHLA